MTWAFQLKFKVYKGRILISPSSHFLVLSGGRYLHAQSYFQLFGQDFESNLSVSWLLFAKETPLQKVDFYLSLRKKIWSIFKKGMCFLKIQ